MYKKWTLKEDQYIVNYANIMSAKELAKNLNRPISHIYTRMSQKELKCLGSHMIWSKTEDKKLKQLLNKFVPSEICIILNRSYHSIKGRISKLNLKCNANIKYNTRKQYSHNEEFFSKLTLESCYWAGVWSADGNVYPRNHIIQIHLQFNDIDFLSQLKKVIDFTGNPVSYIRKSDGYKYAKLVICGAQKNIIGLSKNFNITENKTYTLQPPPLKNERFIARYIAGNMDGDGSIYIPSKRQQWNLTFNGTYNLMLWIKNQIKKYVLNIGDPSIHKGHGNGYELKFTGFQVKTILDWLYKDCTINNRLDRKYKKYLQVREFYKNGPRQYTSQFYGVYKEKKTGGFCAEITYKKKKYYIGYFKDEIQAALAYDNKILELQLDKKLNFPVNKVC